MSVTEIKTIDVEPISVCFAWKSSVGIHGTVQHLIALHLPKHAAECSAEPTATSTTAAAATASPELNLAHRAHEAHDARLLRGRRPEVFPQGGEDGAVRHVLPYNYVIADSIQC